MQRWLPAGQDGSKSVVIKVSTARHQRGFCAMVMATMNVCVSAGVTVYGAVGGNIRR